MEREIKYAINLRFSNAEELQSIGETLLKAAEELKEAEAHEMDRKRIRLLCGVILQKTRLILDWIAYNEKEKYEEE